jgi:methylglyoxal synthase
MGESRFVPMSGYGHLTAVTAHDAMKERMLVIAGQHSHLLDKFAVRYALTSFGEKLK